MWNFLVGVLLTDAAIVLFDGNPGYPIARDVCGTSPTRPEMTCFGTSAAYIVRVHEGRCRACARGRDPERAARVGSTGSPLSPEGFRWVYDQVGAGHVALLDERRHRRVHRVRRWRADAAGLRGRASGPVARREGRGVGRARAGRSSTRSGELVITEPMPSMPIYFWSDPDGERLPRELLLDVPGDLAPRRLDRDHLARDGGHLRPVGLDDQSRRRADRDERDLPRRARRRRGGRRARASTCRATGTNGWMALFVVLREGASLDDDARSPRSGGGSARTARRATFPTRSAQIAEVPRTLSGKVLEVPVKRILDGRTARRGRSPRVARQPGRSGLFHRAGG